MSPGMREPGTLPKKKRKQTRRCVTVSSAHYDELSAYCEEVGRSRSGLIEELINEALDRPTGGERG